MTLLDGGDGGALYAPGVDDIFAGSNTMRVIRDWAMNHLPNDSEGMKMKRALSDLSRGIGLNFAMPNTGLNLQYGSQGAPAGTPLQTDRGPHTVLGGQIGSDGVMDLTNMTDRQLVEFVCAASTANSRRSPIISDRKVSGALSLSGSQDIVARLLTGTSAPWSTAVADSAKHFYPKSGTTMRSKVFGRRLISLKLVPSLLLILPDAGTTAGDLIFEYERAQALIRTALHCVDVAIYPGNDTTPWVDDLPAHYYLEGRRFPESLVDGLVWDTEEARVEVSFNSLPSSVNTDFTATALVVMEFRGLFVDADVRYRKFVDADRIQRLPMK